MNEQNIYDGFERVWKLFEKTDHEIQELKYFLREQSQETDRKKQIVDFGSFPKKLTVSLKKQTKK